MTVRLRGLVIVIVMTAVEIAQRPLLLGLVCRLKILDGLVSPLKRWKAQKECLGIFVYIAGHPWVLRRTIMKVP